MTPVAFLNIQTIYITWKCMYGHPIFCDKKSDIHKTKLKVSMFIILMYVNNFGKNRYLYKIWHADAMLYVPHIYRRSQSKFIFNKSSGKNDPHYGKSIVVCLLFVLFCLFVCFLLLLFVLFFVVVFCCCFFVVVFCFGFFLLLLLLLLFFAIKLDATNSFPSNTTEVRPIYLKMGHIMRKPAFVICEQQRRRSTQSES